MGNITQNPRFLKSLPIVLLALAGLLLAACNGTTVAAAGAYYGITHTKPDALPPADVADQTPPHQSWCYETLGYPECYTHPQLHADNRLINVDPGNLYPLTPGDYDKAAAATVNQ